MKGQLFKLFSRPTKRIVLSALHKAMYPGVNPLLISKDLLVHHKIRKITPLSPEFSDHIGYEVKGSGIFALNMMKRGMQRGERFNNAFSQLETPEQYTNRVIKMAHSIADEIEKNPDITKYLAQEAPIGENYQIFKEVIAQRLSDKWVCHNSDYGVLTMINTEKFAVTEISDDIQLTAGMDFKYKDARFRAFEITESGEDPYILINLHAPHDNQGDTLKVFIKNVIRELGNSERKVVICGDWNSTPQEINKSIQAAYTEIQDSLDEYQFPCPMSISTKYASSHQGHQKALKDGQKQPDLLSVDGVLTLNIKEGSGFNFEHEEEEFNQSVYLGISLAVISGIGLLFAGENEEDDDEEKATLTTTPRI